MLKQIKGIKTKDQARSFAVNWQNWQSKQIFTWYDNITWQYEMKKIGRKFGLIREFKENGII